MSNAPFIRLETIDDIYVRANFKALVDYFRSNAQLAGFKHIEVVVSDMVSNLKVAHKLNYIPKDVLITSFVGPGVLTLNYDRFDSQFMDLSATGACSFRAFIGTYNE